MSVSRRNSDAKVPNKGPNDTEFSVAKLRPGSNWLLF